MLILRAFTGFQPERSTKLFDVIKTAFRAILHFSFQARNTMLCDHRL